MEASYLLNYHYGQIAHYLLVTLQDIPRIINNLDLNKVHGHDKISIRMSKISGDSTCRLLNIIFKTCLRMGKFPMEKSQYCSNS